MKTVYLVYLKVRGNRRNEYAYSTKAEAQQAVDTLNLQNVDNPSRNAYVDTIQLK